jgi:RNA polymerase sigma factor (sigma-70 family)
MSGPLSKALRHLCDDARLHDDARMRDGELLAAFVASRDPTAFEALVRRHGPMVLGVCRRILRHPHDAEDAFQAAFLVLARRAASVLPREAVGNWLYGVACRTALEARRMIARRRAKELQAGAVPRSTAIPESCSPDLLELLDDELNRLPDKLRLPVVLCDLEGRTRREVARQLDIPDGTLSNRLAAGRRALARRLSDRGVTLSSGALTAALAQATAASAVSPPLVTATVRAALAAGPAAAGAASALVSALTEGVLKTMFLAKLKTAAMVVLAIGLVTGLGLCCGLAALPAAAPAATGKKAPAAVAEEEPKKGAESKAVLEQAVQAAKAIKATKDDDLRSKVNRLVMIAHYQARFGDRPGGSVTFKLALEIAGTIKDEVIRAAAQANAGFYQANVGLITEAKNTVEGIAVKDKKKEPEVQGHRNHVLMEIADNLARSGDFKEALKVAESIPVRVIRFKPEGEDKEVERRDPMSRDTALKYVAEAQLRADDVAGALKTARVIQSRHPRFYTLRAILIVQAKSDSAAAGKAFAEMRKEVEADKELFATSGQRSQFLAGLQAAIGDAEGAVAWIKKLESEEERANALLAVSIGLAERDLAKQPKKGS